jgi:hypothetical protein
MKRSLLLFLLIFLLNGCAATVDMVVSTPKKNNDKNYSAWETGTSKFSNKEVVMFLQPDNSYMSQTAMWPPFLPVDILKESIDGKTDERLKQKKFFLELLFRSKKEGYKFNPLDVTLVNKGGSSVKPSKYVRLIKHEYNRWTPSKHQRGSLCYHLGSENEEGEKDVTSKNEFTYIPAAEDKALCYVLEFDVFPPMPGDMYVIKVDGLYEGNQKIDLKEFQFSGSNTIKNTYF